MAMTTTGRSTQLKHLAAQRHLDSHSAFCAEFAEVAQLLFGKGQVRVTPPSESQFKRWCNGTMEGLPRAGSCQVLERMFPGWTAWQLMQPADAVGEGPSNVPSNDEEDPMNRRQLFQLGGATIAAALFKRLWTEPGEMEEVLDSGTVGSARLGALQLEASQLAVQVVRVAPSSLVERTLMQHAEIRRLAGTKQTLAAHRELVRCAAMLGTVMGEILFMAGQFPLARTWYRSAYRSALDAQDQALADTALAGMTYLPTYESDPRGVLELVNPRLDSVSGYSPGIAWLWAFKGKAHARLGEAREFERSIAMARTALDKSPADQIHPGILSFEPQKLEFYEARGWVDLKNPDEAAAAADRALALYDFSETTEPALARLEQASARVPEDVGEACRIATRTVTDPRTYPSVTVITRAHEFDALVRDSDTDDEAVQEWRHVLTSLRTPATPLAALAASVE